MLKEKKLVDDISSNADKKIEKIEFEEFVAIELNILKKLLNQIWGIIDIMQNDVKYIKSIYSTPKKSNKQQVAKQERVTKLKHRIIVNANKINKLH